MNSLIKSTKPIVLNRKNIIPLITTVRNHWNKDFAPGPYPVTQEQRIAAAQKYGIPIEEYEVYPDDKGFGIGDYPKLPEISAESRDPFYPWDNPELKRNFNEPMHENFDCYTEDRYDISKKLHQPLWVLWLQTLGTLGVLYGLYKLSLKAKFFLPVVPPQIPAEGKVHYTFELECD